MKDQTQNNVFYYLMLGVIVVWLVVYMFVMNNSMVSSVPASLTTQSEQSSGMPALQNSQVMPVRRKNTQ